MLDAVDALLGELSSMFPDEFVHFGGDEVETLERNAETAFHRHAVGCIGKLGKCAIGWDECLDADLPPSVVVQAWRGPAARDAALAAGFDCIVSAPYYLDYFYPADVHYAADPQGDLGAADAFAADQPRLAHVRQGLAWMADFASFPDLPARPGGRVLGGEACLWSELVTDDLLDTRLWSRMPAIAELFWRPAEADIAIETATGDLYRHMAASRSLLAKLGIVAEDRAAIDSYPDLTPLIEMLEPVKWYRRLLGESGFVRRVQGIGVGAQVRPYDVTTRLDRIVDRIPPESLASRRAEADLAAGASMRGWLAGWRRQREALDNHPELLAELGAVSAALATLADVLDGKSDADVEGLAGPFGEYLLPVAYAVRRR